MHQVSHASESLWIVAVAVTILSIPVWGVFETLAPGLLLLAASFVGFCVLFALVVDAVEHRHKQ